MLEFALFTKRSSLPLGKLLAYAVAAATVVFPGKSKVIGEDVVLTQSVVRPLNVPSSGCDGCVFGSVAMILSWSKHAAEYVYVAGVLQATVGTLLAIVTPMGQSGTLAPV